MEERIETLKYRIVKMTTNGGRVLYQPQYYETRFNKWNSFLFFSDSESYKEAENFILKDKKMRFEINDNAIKKSEVVYES